MCALSVDSGRLSTICRKSLAVTIGLLHPVSAQHSTNEQLGTSRPGRRRIFTRRVSKFPGCGYLNLLDSVGCVWSFDCILGMRQGKGKSRIPSGIEGWAGFLSLAFFLRASFFFIVSPRPSVQRLKPTEIAPHLHSLFRRVPQSLILRGPHRSRTMILHMPISKHLMLEFDRICLSERTFKPVASSDNKRV